MKFKISFARTVKELQKIEVVIEASNKEEANDKLQSGEFERFLVVKRELLEMNNLGEPEIEGLK